MGKLVKKNGKKLPLCDKGSMECGKKCEISDCNESRLHPLIHTRLEFNAALDIVVFQRFTALGNVKASYSSAFTVSNK